MSAMDSLRFSFEDISTIPPVPRTFQKDDGHDFSYYETKHANVLLIGRTGTGKTTFLNTLRNPQYQSQSRVGDEGKTVGAVLKNIGFKVGEDNYALSIVDTQGFNDSGNSDLMLQKLILDFVKRGISSLSMVLVAIPVNQELSYDDIKCILSAIEFLGAKFRPITYILGTHSEGWTIDDKKEWASQLAKTRLRELLRFTTKFVWSGMIPPQISGTERETMLLGLKENQEKVVLRAIEAKPIKILKQGDDNVMQMISRFEAQESAIKDGMILDDVLPQIEPLVEEIRGYRSSLVPLLEERKNAGWETEKCKQKCDSYLDDTAKYDNLTKELQAWNEARGKIAKYDSLAKDMNEASREVQTLYERVYKGSKELNLLYLTHAVLQGSEEPANSFVFDLN